MAQERFVGPEYHAAFDPKKWIEQMQQADNDHERSNRREETKKQGE